jgi:TolB-like protein/DNA-binding winged helix-turn-helix (wHTH) protein/Tfp pilus assembly protein PilF
VRFGVFEIDLASGELRKRGVKVKLHDQPLRVLTLLLERPGQVVTRDQLKEKLWTADTVVDFDHGLNSAINKVREALTDSADSPRFIETVPRHGYRFIYPVATVPVGTLDFGLLSRPSAGEGTSIAVLPLRNLSGDPGQDYFADGMTEALITELGKLSGLRLLSYQSVLGYRQTAKSLPQIARELNVEVVLEGSVLRAENRIRITANLVQAVPERHLWAESYEFDQRDVLAVQGAAARDVAAQILVKVTPQEKERLVTSKPVDPQAHEAYLLGRAHLYKAGTPTSWMRAKEYFEKAIEKDPTYGPAYASLAELYIWTGGAGSLTSNPTVGASDSHRQARRWAEKALALDDSLADAHNALALAKQAEWDWSAAERGYRRAIELNRSYAVARVSYAIHLYAMQRFEEAVDQAKHAQQLDPVSPFINTWAGAAYFLAGRTDEAMASLRRTLELEPGYSDASIILARSYVTLGQYHEAIAELDKAMTFGARGPFVLAAQAHAYARARRQKEALRLVDELKQFKAKLGITPTFAFIWAYAGLDDKEQAFAWLEKAYEERRQRMVWLNVDAFLDPLRSDPRFDDLVRRVGLPSA